MAPQRGPAIARSCNGYYYRLGLKMQIEGIIEMIETFEYDKRTGIDMPNEKISQTPKSWKPIVERREGKLVGYSDRFCLDRAGYGRRDTDIAPADHRGHREFRPDAYTAFP
jgi:hypothetical protein